MKQSITYNEERDETRFHYSSLPAKEDVIKEGDWTKPREVYSDENRFFSITSIKHADPKPDTAAEIVHYKNLNAGEDMRPNFSI